MYAINLEQYLETLESLPVEMRKKFFQMRDLDKKVVDNLRNVDEMSEAYLNNITVMSPSDKMEQLKVIDKKFKKCRDMSDSKIQLAIQTYEMVDKYIRRLDAELAKFEAKLQHKAAIIMANSNSFASQNTMSQSTSGNNLMGNDGKRDSAGIKRKLFQTSINKRGTYKSRAILSDKKKKGLLKERANARKVPQDDSEDDDDEIPRITSKGNKFKKNVGSGDTNKTAQTFGRNAGGDNLSTTSTMPGLNLSSDEGAAGAAANASTLDGAGVMFPFSHPAQILDMPVDPNEPTYCICHQVSYGEMIGCDNPDCLVEWFHFGCVGLTHKPKGKWYCPSCTEDKGIANKHR